ncbi:hypothetical protein ABE58_00005, partial [Bacillus safensis]|nr:hypothetical protein [Bacillus safensis]
GLLDQLEIRVQLVALVQLDLPGLRGSLGLLEIRALQVLPDLLDLLVLLGLLDQLVIPGLQAALDQQVLP